MQKILLILIGIAIITGCDKSEKTSAKKPGEPRVKTQVEKRVETESLQSIKEKIRDRSLSRNTYGREDPFALIGQTDSGKKKQTQTNKVSNEIRLEGIIWDARHPLAIINGKTVSQGEMIGNKIIEKIEKDAVILFDGKKRIKLRL